MEPWYDRIDVQLFTRRLRIGDGFPARAAAAALVRLAHCQVRPERRDHFVAAQAEVWNPGMTQAPGMRGGVFAERGATAFLVLSLWETTADHERYRTQRFPGLRQRSGAAGDLDRVTGDLVDLVPGWTVPARE